MKYSLLVMILLLQLITACSSESNFEYFDSSDELPNILLMVADDLGYSDLGLFGSEIETPNIDAIARNGVTLANFHANATCSTSRAMLLTGMDNHAVGFGTNPRVANRFPILRGKKGYLGKFVEGVQTLPTRLNNAGYATFLSGKWHLGTEPKSAPPEQGYDRAFYFEHDGASHFADRMGTFSTTSPAVYREDGQQVTDLPDDYFSTSFYTDKVISYIEDNVSTGKPFFAHVAYTAPHWPLQAPDGWLNKYQGRYDGGWELLRSERMSRMATLGLIDSNSPYPPLPAALGLWEELSPEQQQFESRRMEIYAAMISHLDHEIGRLIQYLRDSGQYENTVIVFLSDNGPEGNNIEMLRDNETWLPQNFDQSYENMGQQGSYVWLGRGWAHVSVGPLHMYKSYLAEGGVRVPAILKLPGGTVVGKINHQFISILDIAPTLLEFANIEVSADDSIQGVSQVAMLSDPESFVEGTHNDSNRTVAFEIYGGRSVYRNRWKLLWLWPTEGPGDWQLFDIVSDPGETEDLAGDYPEIVAELSAAWDSYAKTNGVFRVDLDFGYGRYPDQQPEAKIQ